MTNDLMTLERDGSRLHEQALALMGVTSQETLEYAARPSGPGGSPTASR